MFSSVTIVFYYGEIYSEAIKGKGGGQLLAVPQSERQQLTLNLVALSSIHILMSSRICSFTQVISYSMTPNGVASYKI